MSLKKIKDEITGKKRKRKKKSKGSKRASDFGDNPNIRGGRDAATIAHNEPWEDDYVRKKHKKR